ncbi:hypothetical protein V1511DRAFT_510550 [Dipodascopsis uninucleata]
MLSGLDGLPEEVLLRIFTLVVPGDLAALTQTCKLFARIADHDEVWHAAVVNEYTEGKRYYSKYVADGILSWKQVAEQARTALWWFYREPEPASWFRLDAALDAPAGTFRRRTWAPPGRYRILRRYVAIASRFRLLPPPPARFSYSIGLADGTRLASGVVEHDIIRNYFAVACANADSEEETLIELEFAVVDVPTIATLVTSQTRAADTKSSEEEPWIEVVMAITDVYPGPLDGLPSIHVRLEKTHSELPDNLPRVISTRPPKWVIDRDVHPIVSDVQYANRRWISAAL